MTLYSDLIGELFRYAPLSVRDVVDIAIVAFLIYRFLLLLRGTRGAQMTLGLVILLLFYTLTRYYRLRTLEWLFTNLLTYVVFTIIVLYQNEIRRGLARIGKSPWFGKQSRSSVKEEFEEIILAATTLASKKIGALIVVEREIGLKNYAESGTCVVES